MALGPVLTEAPSGVLSAGRVKSLHASIAYQIPYTDDDDHSMLRNLSIISSGGALEDATTLPVSALPCSLLTGTVIWFWNGVRVVLNDDAARGDTSLTVVALEGDVPSLTLAFISSAQFKKSADSEWRQALPPWPTILNQQLRTAMDTSTNILEIDSNANQAFSAGGFPFVVYVGTESMTATAIDPTNSRKFTVTRPSPAGHFVGDMVNRTGGTRLLNGNIFDLDPDTTYNVRVCVVDPVANSEQVVTFDKDTREENITAPGDLTPTHFVNVLTGSDANNGTASGTPWKTLDKAIAEANAASAPMIIEVEGGYYPRPTTLITQTTHRIIFMAADSATCVPAVAADKTTRTPTAFTPTLTNPGNVLIYDRYTAPTGSGEGAADWSIGFGGTGVWQSAVHGGTTLWYLDLKDRSDAFDDQEICHVSYYPVTGGNFAAAKAAKTGRRISTMSQDDDLLATVAGFGAFVESNLSYKMGAWQDLTGAGTGESDTSPSRLFLRMPEDEDPNDYYIFLGQGVRTAATDSFGFGIASSPGGADPGHRVSGLWARTVACGFRLDSGSDYGVVEYCYAEICGVGGLVRGWTAADDLDYTVWQYMRIFDSDLWGDDVITGARYIPWHGIKQAMVLGDGTRYDVNRTLFRSNSSGIWCFSNQAHTTIRHCHMEGVFNGIPTGNVQFDEGDNYNIDVYDVDFKHIADNSFEPAGPTINYKAWDCTGTRIANIFETDTRYGPITAARLTGFEVSNHGITDDNHPTDKRVGAGGGVFKFGANVSPIPRIWLINCTTWTSLKHPSENAQPKYMVSAVAATHAEQFVWINCVSRVMGTLTNLAAGRSLLIVDENNLWGTISAGMMFDGRSFNKTVTTGVQSLAEWREWNPNTKAADGTIRRGRTTNNLGGTDYAFVNQAASVIDAAFEDPANGDLRPKADLAATASLVNAGVPVPNLDVRYVSGTAKPSHFSGLLPDLGSIELAFSEEPPPPDPEPEPEPGESTRVKADKTRRARIRVVAA